MKKELLAIGILLAGICMYSCGDDSNEVQEGQLNPTPIEQENLTVMSYNIHHCAPYRGSGVETKADVSGIAKVIKGKNVDIVFLQEVDSCTTRSFGVDQTKKLAELAGYSHYHFFKQQDYQTGGYGVAVLSKLPLEQMVNHKLPKEVDGQLIKGNNVLGTVKVDYKGQYIHLATTHLSVTESERVKQLPFILKELKRLKNGPIILAGDFNEVPGHGVWDELKKNGFVSTNTDRNKFTIPADKPNRELDYISYCPSDAFSVVSHIVVMGTTASDHLPIMTALKPR